MQTFERIGNRPRRSRLVRPLQPEQVRVGPGNFGTQLLTSYQQVMGNQATQRLAQTCPVFPSRCPTGGACHSCPLPVQAKLTVGRPGDKYEREADRVADEVMRMPDPEISQTKPVSDQPAISRIQRECTDCENEELQRQPEEEEEKEEEPEELAQAKPLSVQITPLIQRQAEPEEEEEEEEETLQSKQSNGHTPRVTPEVKANIEAMRGGGRPLSESERNFFEPRFGRDLSQVRIHESARAANTARALNARAFTIGSDIVLGAGQFIPRTMRGKKLLAHELSHVVQQTAVNETSCYGKLKFTKIINNSRIKSQTITGVRRIAPNKPPWIQRLVRRTRVNCPPLGGVIRNPYRADRRSSILLDNAIKIIHSAIAYRTLLPNDSDVRAVSDALRTAFRLNPAIESTWTMGPPRVRLPVILRRLEYAKNYIDSVVFRFECCNVGPCECLTCEADTEALMCRGDSTLIALCPLFWTRNLDQRARILIHEVIHLNFGFFDDWNQPDVNNPHCYAQFVALLNGFNSSAGYRCH